VKVRSVAVGLVALATFIDLVAYSIAVPVLPDLSRRLGASPTMIGLLFASFGVTLLGVSVPMGAVSDRIGRKAPMVLGLAALSASSVLFAFADRLPWLFLARLVQGAADAVTWVVGFALVADLHKPEERGRVMGLVMSGSNVGFLVGPTLGGWLYEAGGMRVPFLAVAAVSAAVAAAFLALPLPHAERSIGMSLTSVLKRRSVAICTLAVITVSGTIAMLEPVLSMHLAAVANLGPASVGLVFGVGAIVSMMMHPLFGHLADRWGARPLTLAGLAVNALTLIVLSQSWSLGSAMGFFLLQAMAMAMVVTPSLAYMAEATSESGARSFGIAYGVYNFAWAIGLLGGPAVGGFLFDRVGFGRLALLWAPLVLTVTLALRMSVRRMPMEVARVEERGVESLAREPRP
jgi:multidrug resistance protein